MKSDTSEKQELRRRAYDARAAQTETGNHSRTICNRFFALPEYQQADTAMLYLHCRSEVQTQAAVAEQLESGKRIVIPYCTLDEQGHNKLGLWHLQSFDELVPGMWNIPEPPRERRGAADKEVSPASIDIIMVPGVAFDTEGARLGNGQGYYDRLLALVRPDTRLIGVGFQCQIFNHVPMDRFDVHLDGVITESAHYCGRGRK